jgi:hypothetical protein
LLLSLSKSQQQHQDTMPPKKKNAQSDDLGMMRAARFGRVKNDLSMGFVGLPNVRIVCTCFFYTTPILESHTTIIGW